MQITTTDAIQCRVVRRLWWSSMDRSQVIDRVFQGWVGGEWCLFSTTVRTRTLERKSRWPGPIHVNWHTALYFCSVYWTCDFVFVFAILFLCNTKRAWLERSFRCILNYKNERSWFSPQIIMWAHNTSRRSQKTSHAKRVPRTTATTTTTTTTTTMLQSRRMVHGRSCSLPGDGGELNFLFASLLHITLSTKNGWLPWLSYHIWYCRIQWYTYIYICLWEIERSFLAYDTIHGTLPNMEGQSLMDQRMCEWT